MYIYIYYKAIDKDNMYDNILGEVNEMKDIRKYQSIESNQGTSEVVQNKSKSKKRDININISNISKGEERMSNKKEQRIVFRLKGKELAWISLEGLFSGEVRETKGLLAFENKVNESEIKAVYREA